MTRLNQPALGDYPLDDTATDDERGEMLGSLTLLTAPEGRLPNQFEQGQSGTDQTSGKERRG